MSTKPRLLPTSVHGETFAGVTYHLDGELVPALTVEVTPDQPVYFEHHIMRWKDVSVDICLRAMGGIGKSMKRMFAGLQVFITEARGQGSIGFSRDGVGHVFPIHLEQGRTLHVREHQFLAATKDVAYDFQFVKGAKNMLFGGTGLFIDEFTAAGGPGILWLHGYGNVFEVDLEAGESIDVNPGSWLYKDPTVDMKTRLQKVTTGVFGSMTLLTNRFTGPGRVGIQSMTPVIPEAK